MEYDEIDLCNLVVDMLSEERDREKFGTEDRSSSYVTLMYCDNDFFRAKYSDRSKWISIRLAKEDKDVNDERFKAQKNKNQLHWKAEINDINDIYKFKKELLNACVSFASDEYIPRKHTKSRIVIGPDMFNE